MKVLVVGSGGREHALGHALARAPEAPALLFAPGNAGTHALGRNVPVSADDVDGLVALARDEAVDLVVVGPEAPLALGLVDRLRAAGVAVVGPVQAAARLESSKAHAKAFMQRYGIPTAAHHTFAAADREAALAYVDERFAAGQPVVVKASGLAAGKGVVVAETVHEAWQAVDDMLGGAYGEAGASLVVEDRMEGEEASVFVLTDGTSYTLLPPAQDHKRALDGDRGPNTGGMGAYAPAPVVTGALLTEVCRTIVEPTLMGLTAEGTPFTGFLYVGLMLTEAGPKVVEYNVRLGDPETQAVLPLVTSDLLALCRALATGRLRGHRVAVREGAAATVVLAAPGYPGAYPKGLPVSGLEAAAEVEGATVYHAGTALDAAGNVVTSGGRVFSVTGVGATLDIALERAYAAADRIAFEGKQLRRDIGHRALGAPAA